MLKVEGTIRLKGSVKWFNNTKGFGFIVHASGRDVFVHYSQIQWSGYKTLREGEEVEYEVIEGPKGLHALKVTRLNPPMTTETEQLSRSIGIGNADTSGSKETSIVFIDETGPAQDYKH